MNIKPLFDRIVVKAVECADKTESGLFLPSSAKEKPQSAQVIAVGPGGMVDGKQVIMQIKVGDVVLSTNIPAAISNSTAKRSPFSVRVTFWQSSKNKE